MEVFEFANVSYDNSLVEAVYNYNKLELRAFVALVYLFQNNCEVGNDEVVLEMKDIKKLLNSKNRIYERFKSTLTNIMKKPIKLKGEDGIEVLFTMFPTIKFDEKNKKVIVRINKDGKSLITNLKNKFTTYGIGEFINLEHKYSQRIYQMFNRYRVGGCFRITIGELRRQLDLPATYDNMKSINKYVLNPSIAEIREVTKMEIGIKKEYQGRKVTAIKFFIETDQEISAEVEEAIYSAKKNIFLSCALKESHIKTLLSQGFSNEDIIKALKIAYKEVKCEVKSPVGYLKKVINNPRKYKKEKDNRPRLFVMPEEVEPEEIIYRKEVEEIYDRLPEKEMEKLRIKLTRHVPESLRSETMYRAVVMDHIEKNMETLLFP